MTGVAVARPRCAARLLDLAFPARCPGCGARGRADLRGLPARRSTPGSTCPPASRSGCRPTSRRRCSSSSGARRSAASSGARSTSSSTRGEHAARRCRSARRSRGAGARVGAGGDVLVPVPVHADRARRRGYDQAELIARGRRARPRPAVRADPRAGAGDDRPVRPRPARRGPRTSPARSGSGAARRRAPPRAAAGRSRAAGSSSSTTSSRPARRSPPAPLPLLEAGALGVSAVTVARER